jgi:hypothetical protein
VWREWRDYPCSSEFLVRLFSPLTKVPHFLPAAFVDFLLKIEHFLWVCTPIHIAANLAYPEKAKSDP